LEEAGRIDDQYAELHFSLAGITGGSGASEVIDQIPQKIRFPSALPFGEKPGHKVDRGSGDDDTALHPFVIGFGCAAIHV
jgi:hypothetical protein